MIEKKSIYKFLTVSVMLIAITAIFLSGCKPQKAAVNETAISSTTVAETTSVQTQPTEQLSEQPDKAKFNEYFTEFYLGKLPKGTDANPSNVPIKTTVFTSEDQFCSVWTQKKDIPAGSLSGAIYDIVAQKDFEPKTAFNMAISAGGHMGSQPLSYPPGKYEYKLYIDDVLVAVLPFEVK
ncbi:MAG: hypothetical protein M1308_23840 [Actinobacteria bacterium]|nr:hypothetical protein [Actinomycetota bacterium]